MSTETTEEDPVLFVVLSPNRIRILKYLREKEDDIPSHEISNATKIKMGTVCYHCEELAKREMITKKMAGGKAMWKIAEKGSNILQEIDKREKGKNSKKKTLSKRGSAHENASNC